MGMHLSVLGLRNKDLDGNAFNCIHLFHGQRASSFISSERRGNKGTLFFFNLHNIIFQNSIPIITYIE